MQHPEASICAQVVTEYDDSQLQDVLDLTERMEHHLTAAVVSNDIHFLNKARCPVDSAVHAAASLRLCKGGGPQLVVEQPAVYRRCSSGCGAMCRCC